MTFLRAVGRFYGRYAQFGGRAGRAARPAIERTARAGHAALRAACEALRGTDAVVEWLDAAAARWRTLALLDLDPVRPDGEDSAWPNSLPPGPLARATASA